MQLRICKQDFYCDLNVFVRYSFHYHSMSVFNSLFFFLMNSVKHYRAFGKSAIKIKMMMMMMIMMMMIIIIMYS